jgi:hypothetical protein
MQYPFLQGVCPLVREPERLRDLFRRHREIARD